MVFQNYALIDSLSVIENVAFPLIQSLGLSQKEARKQAGEVLETLDLGHAIERLPASLSGSNNGGVSGVRPSLTAVSYTASVNLQTYNGAFFPVDAQSAPVNILLDDLGGSTKVGTEFVFFALDATNDITFTSVTGTTTIVCSGSLSAPKIAGTGMAVVAKFIERSGVPYKWALIGAIK